MDTKLFKKYIKTADIDILRKMKTEADDIYHNTGKSTGLTNEQYDLLKDTLNKRDVKVNHTNVGSKVRNQEIQVTLEHPLWSMDKVTDEKKILSWLSKNNTHPSYIVEEKIDGVSCMAVFDNGSTRLYTRGDGFVGTDISHLVGHIKNIPSNITQKLFVRGELVVYRTVFETKYADMYANARNMVSGCVNAKTTRIGSSDIHFIAYEIIQLGMIDAPTEEISFLKRQGFEVVKYITIPSISLNTLQDTLISFKAKSIYEIDGIIVQPDRHYIRSVNGNPPYAVAFKMQFETATSEVIKVHWEVSKWKQIKPRVEITPTKMNGVMITFLTGYNAKYIVDNSIGPGAVIEFTRSGDVIPKILTVLKPAKVVDLPDDIPFVWNETQVDIMAVDDDLISSVKMTSDFFDKIGVKNVGEKSVMKIYEAGYNSISKIFEMKEVDFEAIDGFGKALAKRTYTNLQKASKDIPLHLLLGSSGVFGYGIGVRRITLLFNDIPDLLTCPLHGLTDRILKVEGFSDKTALKIVEGLSTAKCFISDMKRLVTITECKRVIPNENQMNIVFSGFRDADLEKRLVDKGHLISNTVSTKTLFVVVENEDYKQSTKTKKALSLNVKILTKDEIEGNCDL